MYLTSVFALLGTQFACLAFALTVSRQVSLQQDQYFLPPDPVGRLGEWDSSDVDGSQEFVPLTVVRLNESVGADAIIASLEDYNATDDVWTRQFTTVLSVYIPEDESVSESDLLDDISQEYDVQALYTTEDGSGSPPPGPYFVHRRSGDVYQAYKLFEDTNQAFIQSSYQDANGTHWPLHAAGQSAGGLSIGVPSKLYFSPTEEKPLAGVRVAVKDLYDLKGLKTSGGNRALYATSRVKTETAYAVQKLIDAGAIVIGKNKLSEFAFAGPEVTEHIDYLLPFNPRGDGYNSPGDSSGGSGASVASYDWLDISMGSDTGGSIRGPAASNGVHGNRPTQNAVNLTGALVLSSAMDTSGLLARDPIVWSKANRVLYSDTTRNYTSLPTKIYLDPTVSQMLNETEQDFPDLYDGINDFIETLTDLLSANTTVFAADEVWSDDIPEGVGNATLADLVNGVYGNLTRYEQWTEFGKDFVERYRASHDGSWPHMTHSTRAGWLFADENITEVSHAQDLDYKSRIEEWALEKFMVKDNETCSEAIYITFNWPANSFQYKPNVTEDYANPWIADLQSQLSEQKSQIMQLNATVNCMSTLRTREACEGSIADLKEEATESQEQEEEQVVSSARLASVAGLPDYAITLGAYDMGDLMFSDSSRKNQSLPLAVDIIAAPGCDFMLLNLVEALHRRQAVKTVRTGPIP